MEAIKNIFIDSLNGFALNQIPLLLFQLLCAALGAFILQLIVNKKWGEVLLRYSALTGASIALLASVAKYSLPVSVLGAALILLLLGKKVKFQFEIVAQLLVVLIGLGCGVGAVVQTIIGCVVLFAILIFTPITKENA